MARKFDEFRRNVDHADATKPRPSHGDDSSLRMVRLYCTAHPDTFGDEARWNLQVFAPLKLANGRDGRDRIVATASMSPEALRALRDAINDALVPYASYVRRGKRRAGRR